MSEGRKRFRAHVRAAKEWLGRAEHSLDKDNDVRGDLNVMLAQAELQRAKESQGISRRTLWVKRAAPVLAASLMVIGCWTFLRMEQPVPASGIVTKEAVLVKSAGTESKEALAPEPAKTVPALSAPVHTVAVPAQHAETSAAREPAASAEKQPAAQEENRQTVQIPSKNMQKLMSTAGQALRAQ